jgi:hypothetical protein
MFISYRKTAAFAQPLIGAKQGEIKENVDVTSPLPYLRTRGAGADAMLASIGPEAVC